MYNILYKLFIYKQIFTYIENYNTVYSGKNIQISYTYHCKENPTKFQLKKHFIYKNDFYLSKNIVACSETGNEYVSL